MKKIMKLSILFGTNGKKKGFTLIEMVLSLFITALLGATLLTMVSTALGSYRQILSESDSADEARIAMSFIGIKLRQNDIADEISTDVAGLSGNKALKVGESLIYMYKGYLTEERNGQKIKIAKIADFEFNADYDSENNIDSINIKIYPVVSNSEKEINYETVFVLKSGKG